MPAGLTKMHLIDLHLSCTCCPAHPLVVIYVMMVQEEWWATPVEGQKPGDYVIMRAEMNCVCIMSACPSDDICGINGPDGTQDVHFEVLQQA